MPPAAGDDALAGALGTLPWDDAEGALLAAAGQLAGYRAAGWQPPVLEDAPSPAPADERPLCSPGATAILVRLLESGPTLLLSEWLRLARAAGVSPAPELLPALRDTGADGTWLRAPLLGAAGAPTGVSLGGADLARDRALAALYEDGEGEPGERRGGLEGSAPRVARWLGDIREYFPSTVVRVMQRDAMERLRLDRLLLEPEMLEAVEPDVHLVGTLLSLTGVIPERLARDRARDRAHGRRRPREAPDAVHPRGRRRRDRPRRAHAPAAPPGRRRLAAHDPGQPAPLPAGVQDDHPRDAARSRAPQPGRRARHRPRDRPERVDGELRRVLERLRGRAREPALRRHEARRVRHERRRPHRGAARPGRSAVRRPARRRDGHQPRARLLPGARPPPDRHDRRAHLRPHRGRHPRGDAAPRRRDGRRRRAGIALLALSDEGAPVYDHDNAAALATLGMPAFACTPDLFPQLMAAAIERRDVGVWAGEHGIVTSRAADPPAAPAARPAP